MNTVFISLNDVKTKNTNNYYQYAPFKFILEEDNELHNTRNDNTRNDNTRNDNTRNDNQQNNNNNKILIFDFKFYNQEIKDSWFLDEIKHYFKIKIGTEYEKITYGKEPYIDDLDFFTVYHLHLNWYNADKWWKILELQEDAKFLTIEQELIENIKRKDFSDIIPKLDELINPIIEGDNFNESKGHDKLSESKGHDKLSESKGVFVKTSRHSTKHDFPPEELFNGKEVVEHLFSSNTILKSFNSKYIKTNGILIKKWNTNINKENEFRVFINNSKIIGISQQYIYSSVSKMLYYWSKIPNIVLEKCQILWNDIQLKLEPKYKYTNLCLDVWLDSENDNKAYLIEINGAGYWSADGSSLFEWEKDYPRLELRIVD